MQLCRRAGVQPLHRARPLASRPVPGWDLGKGPILFRPSCSLLPSTLVSLFPAGQACRLTSAVPAPGWRLAGRGPSAGNHSQVTSDLGPPALSLPVLRVLWDCWPPWARCGAPPARNAGSGHRKSEGPEAHSHGDPLPCRHRRSQGAPLPWLAPRAPSSPRSQSCR